MPESVQESNGSGAAAPISGHPWFDHWFSLFPSYRAIIRGLMRRTPAVRSSNGLSFRSLGLPRSRQPLTVSGTRGLRVLTIPGRSYRIRLHVSACYPKHDLCIIVRLSQTFDQAPHNTIADRNLTLVVSSDQRGADISDLYTMSCSVFSIAREGSQLIIKSRPFFGILQQL